MRSAISQTKGFYWAHSLHKNEMLVQEKNMLPDIRSCY